jgi:carbamoyl-phosphate synthase/aspartate carbamoyltransferase/dihydroorotase
MIKLPGLIDPHVHLRDPGQTHKEDIATGTQAALAGGFTMVCDMPNNATPITTAQLLLEKRNLGVEKAVCDIGFHFGSLGDNLLEFMNAGPLSVGLKLYLNMTTGGFIIDIPTMKKIYKAWHEVVPDKPIALHAESDVMPMVIDVLHETPHPTHICHVSSKFELNSILQAKSAGLPITCGVCPHHLFLSIEDQAKQGAYCCMKPDLKTTSDIEFLWQHWADIDIIESDHAPHTREEKDGPNPPFGVPGLETTLPLLINELHTGRVKIEDIVSKCHTRPMEIFHLPPQENTYIEIDENTEYEIRNELLFTKCHWSPFAGRRVRGKLTKTVLRGETVYSDGIMNVMAGAGHVIM